MAQSNTEEQQPTESTEAVSEADIKAVDEKAIEQKVESIQKALSDAGVENGILIFQLPGEDEEIAFRTIQRGHFYDTLQMVSKYVRECKKRIASELDGIA